MHSDLVSVWLLWDGTKRRAAFIYFRQDSFFLMGFYRSFEMCVLNLNGFINLLTKSFNMYCFGITLFHDFTWSWAMIQFILGRLANITYFITGCWSQLNYHMWKKILFRLKWQLLVGSEFGALILISMLKNTTNLHVKHL